MQDDWGMSIFGRREKQRAREREKKRRQRAIQALRVSQPATVSLENRTYEIFVTASGLSAVRSRIRQIAWSGEPRPPISMPYVPFLHGRTLREAR